MTDLSYKLVITGETGTGKTSLLRRISRGKFEENLDPTIAGDVFSVDITVDNKIVHLTIWDTSGTEDYKSMNATHFADAQGVLYLYSFDNSDSLENILTLWKPDVESNSKVDHINFLAGNKSDLPSSEVTTDSERETAVANSLGAENNHVSALNGNGVPELLQQICKKLIEKFYVETPEKQEYVPPEEGGCCRI